MQHERPLFVMSKCCAFRAQVLAGWGLPLAVPLLTWAVFQKVATFFLMTRYTSNHNIYMVSIHCWVLEKFSQQLSISIFTRNSPTQALSTLRKIAPIKSCLEGDIQHIVADILIASTNFTEHCCTSLHLFSNPSFTVIMPLKRPPNYEITSWNPKSSVISRSVFDPSKFHSCVMALKHGNKRSKFLSWLIFTSVLRTIWPWLHLWLTVIIFCTLKLLWLIHGTKTEPYLSISSATPSPSDTWCSILFEVADFTCIWILFAVSYSEDSIVTVQFNPS